MKNFDYPVNEMTGLVVAETLIRMGVKRVVISPGSRSTPLTCAFASHGGFKNYVVLDERSAAFFALGMAKQSDEVIGLVCTSGSAVANYLPAIVEARYSHVPLLVMTADRPERLQNCHAGQTIEQQGIFENFINWEWQMEEPAPDLGYFHGLQKIVREGVEECRIPMNGVVHLNFPFDLPLTPSMKAQERTTFIEEVFKDWAPSDKMVPQETDPHEELKTLILSSYQKILIVAGPSYEKKIKAIKVLAFAEKFGATVLVDALNPLRNIEHRFECLVSNYHWILGSEKCRAELKPDLVIQIGDLPASTTLRSALEEWKVDRCVVAKGGDKRDPTFSHLVAEYESLEELEEQAGAFDSESATDFYKVWREKEEKIEELLDREITPQLQGAIESEVHLCRRFDQLMSADCSLFVSSSMIVRDMEMHWKGSPNVDQIISNRGANGIDGNLSTAFGVSERKGGLAVCLIGDLAFCHDLSASFLTSQLNENSCLIFLVLDNDGGGIFEHLEIAKQDPPFEEYFATPQVVDVAKHCEAFGVNYVQPKTWEDLRRVFESGIDGESVKSICIHLKFCRKESYGIRVALRKKVAELLS
ncbi:MAG: 2-succinyl-5-enolpyruvyl-6-hydroxy-3-cyclohexene-1-carboxylic-acid synthase [Opitutales bacterium]|nr:2-succinyl-5-enolpyruvyl-6-hydroxy-3-cyclohexene-1-carboxylic-acid synthase [Opitutales bacterium]